MENIEDAFLKDTVQNLIIAVTKLYQEFNPPKKVFRYCTLPEEQIPAPGANYVFSQFASTSERKGGIVVNRELPPGHVRVVMELTITSGAIIDNPNPLLSILEQEVLLKPLTSFLVASVEKQRDRRFVTEGKSVNYIVLNQDI